MNAVVDLDVVSLISELYLMCKNVSSLGIPVDYEAPIAGDPFCGNVGIYLHVVGVAVVRRRGDGVVGERERLVHKI